MHSIYYISAFLDLRQTGFVKNGCSRQKKRDAGRNANNAFFSARSMHTQQNTEGKHFHIYCCFIDIFSIKMQQPAKNSTCDCVGEVYSTLKGGQVSVFAFIAAILWSVLEIILDLSSSLAVCDRFPDSTNLLTSLLNLTTYMRRSVA